MEIITSLKDVNQINLDVDGFFLGTRFGVRNDMFSLRDIEYIIKNTNKNVYVNVDKIFNESELDEVKQFLIELKRLNIDGIYYSDMSVFTISEELDIIDKLIYNPGTLVTNYEDALFYLRLGVKRVCLAREITLADILKIMEYSTDIEVIIHGNLNMFYSKRNLLTNFFEFTNQEVRKKGHLVEEIRSERYPITEDETGTHIFQGEILNSFKELMYFKNITVRIDGFLQDEKYIEDVTNIYANLRNDFDEKKAFKDYSINYDVNELSTGYYYKETKYIKK
ncbi:U32 family peptidase [Mycoplasmatota bacterium zrk1]